MKDKKILVKKENFSLTAYSKDGIYYLVSKEKGKRTNIIKLYKSEIKDFLKWITIK